MLQLQTIDNIETHTGVIAFSHDSHSGHQCDIIMVAVNVQSSDEYWSIRSKVTIFEPFERFCQMPKWNL